MDAHRVIRLSVSLVLLAMLVLAGCQPIQRPAATDAASEVAPLLGNLGDHTHPITTESEVAQQYFDEGLILTYGFNHALAIQSFQNALKLDPDCAMCYWGIAYALGPNINAPMDPAAVPDAWAALQQAIALAPNASEAEQAYIQALSTRYSEDPNADRAALDLAYADAMRELMQSYPEDADAVALFAEALMDLTPWNYWTKAGEATEYTEEILATLDAALALDPNHPGANHFYIHATEASLDPGRALPSAQRLETLVPGAGHLRHMPAHTYWRVGMYADAARVNEHAIHTDENTVGGTPDDPTHGFYALGYYPHNIHFLSTAAQMQGRSGVALEAARKVAETIPDEAATAVPGLQDFDTIPFFALVRFGKWDEILAEPQPLADHQYTTGIWHWARGMAHAGMGDLEQAQAEYEAVLALAQSEAMQALALPSFSTGANNLTMAGHILAAELAGAAGETDQQIAELEAAVQIQDDMAYIEPPAWYFPVRHLLGAALLAADRPADAEAVFRTDLEQYPQNGWSLFGLMQSLEAQGNTAEAADVQQAFEQAWQNADVTLTTSRF
jgi:tetratricopeptide (TPR) repeat protein